MTGGARATRRPGPGSDLASLKTRAVRDGDHYVVNGQKTWTTLAQYANWIFCLVRTRADGKPQAGISFLLIDMTTPGVTRAPDHHPRRRARGQRGLVRRRARARREPRRRREPRLDVCQVPAWATSGRTSPASAPASASSSASRRSRPRRRETGVRSLDDPYFAARIAQVEIDLMALEVTNLRVLSAERSRRDPGAHVVDPQDQGLRDPADALRAHAPCRGPRRARRPARRDERRHGLLEPAHAAPLAGGYFNLRKTTIYGGANEIQRNIIAHMILGL